MREHHESAESRQVRVADLRSWASDVLNEVSIKDVRLRRLEADSGERPVEGPYSVSTELRFRGEQVDHRTIETISEYRVVCTQADEAADAPEDGTEVWHVECELRGSFLADEEKDLVPFGPDQLNAFAMVVGVIHIHPYARETVQSISSRLGYPPFTLDGLTPITALSDDSLVDFGGH